MTIRKMFLKAIHGIVLAIQTLLAAVDLKVDIVDSRLVTIDNEIAIIDTKIGALSTTNDIVELSAVTNANWNTGFATSTLPGADLVLLNIPDRMYINHFDVVIGGLLGASVITIRKFHTVNGVDEMFYSQQFTVGTDPNAIPIYDSQTAENHDLRIELYSNNPGDDGTNIPYEVK